MFIVLNNAYALPAINCLIWFRLVAIMRGLTAEVSIGTHEKITSKFNWFGTHVTLREWGSRGSFRFNLLIFVFFDETLSWIDINNKLNIIKCTHITISQMVKFC